MSNIVDEIKNRMWDYRVKRPGFLQSKSIVNDAIVQPVIISKSITVKYDDAIWVGDAALYDDKKTKSFSEDFKVAFNEDKDWPLKIVAELDKIGEEAIVFMSNLEIDWNKKSIEDKKRAFTDYVSLLMKIQRYYVLAVPLTNYCEKELKEKAPELLHYSHAFKDLDVDKMHKSLINIKKSSLDTRDKLIAKHLKQFAWIKGSYNIIESYTKDNVLEEIKSDLHSENKADIPENKYRYIATGLQCGIYLRNRMKELSQMLWFYFDELAKSLAKDFGLTREDFLQMNPEEVVASIKSKKSVLTKSEIAERDKGFVVGILDNEYCLITGKEFNELDLFFNHPKVEEVKEIKGNVACRGLVKGTVKVVFGHKQFTKLEKGNILVTSMTTPDYVIVMKKAGAIVTDEGGLSCHAAIVSRELNIPCVIGTKIATKVLRDGDLVEVDAEKGIVKIIKKA